MVEAQGTGEQYLAGKLTIITGAGKPAGIGIAIARELAGHGADIVLHYHTSKENAEKNVAGLRELGVQAVAVQGDARELGFGADLVKATLDAFPGRKIDIIVNNHVHGYYEACASAAPLANFDGVFQSNVRTPHALLQAAQPHLAAPGARIVNIGSLASRQAPMYSVYYAASKAAADTLMRAWAEELGPQGITVNTIAPGPIGTDVIPPEEAPLMQKLRTEQYIKRNGTPEEVAIAVAFMVHPKASFITGQRIPVDGGISF